MADLFAPHQSGGLLAPLEAMEASRDARNDRRYLQHWGIKQMEQIGSPHAMRIAEMMKTNPGAVGKLVGEYGGMQKFVESLQADADRDRLRESAQEYYSGLEGGQKQSVGGLAHHLLASGVPPELIKSAIDGPLDVMDAETEQYNSRSGRISADASASQADTQRQLIPVKREQAQAATTSAAAASSKARTDAKTEARDARAALFAEVLSKRARDGLAGYMKTLESPQDATMEGAVAFMALQDAPIEDIRGIAELFNERDKAKATAAKASSARRLTPKQKGTDQQTQQAREIMDDLFDRTDMTKNQLDTAVLRLPDSMFSGLDIEATDQEKVRARVTMLSNKAKRPLLAYQDMPGGDPHLEKYMRLGIPSVEGTTKDNPILATPDSEPPPGTWVKLPSGKVIQWKGVVAPPE